MEDSSVPNSIGKIKSSSDLIAELVSLLRAENCADNELIDILESSILKEKPSGNAAIEALRQIKLLAELRAKETSDVT